MGEVEMNNYLERAIRAYVMAFLQVPPAPFGIDDDVLATALDLAVLDGKPIERDYNWWAYLPPDTVTCVDPPPAFHIGVS
jgi:hypothetical protein